MAIFDSVRGGYRIFVGDLGPRVGKMELEKEFSRFGPITDVWIARSVGCTCCVGLRSLQKGVTLITKSDQI